MKTTNNHNIDHSLMDALASRTRSMVDYQAFNTPVLQQWQQLISKIRNSANGNQWVTLINPPFIPNDKYLNEIGLGHCYIRVIKLDENNENSKRYIQQCLQNGKSSIVALWASNELGLPEILLNDAPVACQALVFAELQATESCYQQMEMAV